MPSMCNGGVEAGVPKLVLTVLPLRLSMPLQLVARLSGGAGGALFLRTLGGEGLLAACSIRECMGRFSVPKLAVGSANSRKMWEPRSLSYMWGLAPMSPIRVVRIGWMGCAECCWRCVE